MNVRSLLATLVLVMIGMGTGVSGAEEPSPMEVIATWQGKVADPALEEMAGPFITDADTWRSVFTAWRPAEELPSIDFDKYLVLVGTSPGPNVVIYQPKLDEAGRVSFVAGATRMAGPGFGYLLTQVSREGVKSINGTPLESGGTAEQIVVQIVGKLQTGVMAIGAETTGTTITSGEITWEVDFAGDEEMMKMGDSLNGKLVQLEGQLRRVAGVEIPVRWVVTATSLESAP